MESLRYIGNHRDASAVKQNMRVVVTSALVLALAAGCGTNSDSPSPPPSEPPDSLLLEVERIPGGPVVALYSDGRLFTPAPQIAIYPPPALPGYNVAQLSPDRAMEVLDSVARSGLMDEGDSPPVGDAPETLASAYLDGELR